MIKTPEKEFLSIVSKYLQKTSDGKPYGEVIQSMYDNTQNPDMLIPVIGLQGVGKSTFINGILEEEVMPNEGDETTCVPIEVRYAGKPSVCVYYNDGRKVDISVGELDRYADNNYNPGNKLGISAIKIFRDIEILKSGLVLVDLPGVLSMTAENQKTTIQYAQNAYTAIFVIHTVPTITRTEAIFIEAMWRSKSNVMFIQNRWDDERDEQVEEGLEENLTILKNISSKHNIPFNDEIIVINAYKAIAGILQKRPEDRAESNIGIITDKLQDLSVNRNKYIETSYNEFIRKIVDGIKRKINEKLENCQMSKEALAEKLRIEKEKFDKDTREIQDISNKIYRDIGKKEEESKTFTGKLVRKTKENIRSNIFRVIDNGVVDGEHLTKAFDDIQQQEFELLSSEYINYTDEMIYELSALMKELGEILNRENNFSFNTQTINRDKQFKWEKGMDAGFRLAGAVGGILAGTKIGGMIGTAVFPGFGTIVGLVAGSLIGLVGAFIGSKSRKVIVQERAREAKKEIEPIINKLCEGIKQQLLESFNDILNTVVSEVKNIIAVRQASAEQKRIENEEILKNEYDSEAAIRELEQDRMYLTEMEDNINV